MGQHAAERSVDDDDEAVAVGVPGVFILLSVLGVNALGDGLRDALDVRMKE